MFGAIVGRGIGILVLLTLFWKVIARGLSPLPSGILLGILDGANLIFPMVLLLADLRRTWKQAQVDQ